MGIADRTLGVGSTGLDIPGFTSVTSFIYRSDSIEEKISSRGERLSSPASRKRAFAEEPVSGAGLQ
jgi:hypothetical protein